MKRLTFALLCLCLLCPASAAAEPKYVALTFDDGPSGRFTQALLDGLEQRQVHATFLLCGYRMAQYPELTARVAAGGHEIGLHGYSHSCMGCMSDAQLRQELDQTLALLPQGTVPRFLRPPGGICSATVTAAARDYGLALLNWSVDPRDWATHDAFSVVQAVVSCAGDGDVILLHDMSDSSVQAALEIIDTLQSRGFQFLTVSQLAERQGILPEPGKQYRAFPGSAGAAQSSTLVPAGDQWREPG